MNGPQATAPYPTTLRIDASVAKQLFLGHMARNVRGLDRNDDAAIEHLAGAVLVHDGYMWDVIWTHRENCCNPETIAKPAEALRHSAQTRFDSLIRSDHSARALTGWGLA